MGKPCDGGVPVPYKPSPVCPKEDGSGEVPVPYVPISPPPNSGIPSAPLIASGGL